MVMDGGVAKNHLERVLSVVPLPGPRDVDTWTYLENHTSAFID